MCNKIIKYLFINILSPKPVRNISQKARNHLGGFSKLGANGEPISEKSINGSKKR
jgi:hypothetical protein